MKISQIMQRKFHYFDADDTLAFAAATLAKKGMGESIVMERGKYVGMIGVPDIAAALVKRSVFGKPTEADLKKVRNEKISAHIKPGKPHLPEDADILSAFMLLMHRNAEVIPVLGRDGRVLGAVRVKDLRREMAKMLAEKGKVPSRVPSQMQQADANSSMTMIDHVLHFVQEKGKTNSDEVAKKFNIPVSEVEEYALCLQKNHLLKMDYDMFGKTKLMRVE